MKIKDRLFLSSLIGGIAAVIANIFLPDANINMPELTAEFFLNITLHNIDLITRSLGFV
ncbi:hypothetical protein [Sporohalobacter salinus]|uniref:hypothetical protein n=1 Tax=Sporohalobacter salinus TaxID=1494606 RepID=UPI0019615714|nr:hypothetical protein [Sporohalobacter salinus]MBM7625110.1 hypothetical protein [Sporohalobacter salinus]